MKILIVLLFIAVQFYGQSILSNKDYFPAVSTTKIS